MPVGVKVGVPVLNGVAVIVGVLVFTGGGQVWVGEGVKVNVGPEGT